MKLNIKRTVGKDVSTDKILAFLLKDRGITADQEFLNPPHPKDIDFSSFFPKSFNFDKKFEKVIELLQKIKEENRTIIVYTDYDADGITGGAILWETLHLLDLKVMPYVPDRKTEGYGFSEKGIDAVKEKYDPALIISVDHGIMGHEQISYAKSLGISVIVTDHHQKGETEPEAAFAIFHTDKLSGSGVSYFFSKKIFDSFPSPTTNYQLLTTNFSGDYLALASVGTIADLVPVVGASRSVVKYGLEAFAKTRRHGILHLLKQAQIADKEISPYEIGFIIAPRINAFGRSRSRYPR
jgi:single-stranded-DNA-specific exonuclease